MRTRNLLISGLFAVTLLVPACRKPPVPAQSVPEQVCVEIPVAEQNKFELAQKQVVLLRTSVGQGSAVVFRKLTADYCRVRWVAFTAAHVVEGDEIVQAVVTHRMESHKAGVSIYQAHVIKIDTNADIALLLINAPAGAFLGAEFALETPARVGDPVFAVGNFFGNAFDNSVSQGIISQIGIDPGNGFPWPVADQTDCAAFPGSSGGPLFNTDGKVLGLVVGGRDSALVWFVPVRAIVEFAERNQVTWSVVGVFCPRDVNP